GIRYFLDYHGKRTDDVPAIPEPILVDENEESEEEEPQEEEDMEVDIEEDENEPELMFPYEESDPLNPPSPASDLRSKMSNVSFMVIKGYRIRLGTTKDDLRNAYEKCNDIPQESHALIDNFLKEGFDKDYELNLSMYKKAAKIEKQMNAKLVWLQKIYNYRSQTDIGGLSLQTYEICDVYLTTKELHQLRLDEEALRETLKEEARDKKQREEKIRQKQADDEKFILEFGVKYDSEYDENDPWEPSLDINDSDLHLTPVLRPSSSILVEPSPSTPNPVRIIAGPAGIVQAAKLLKQKDILLGLDGAVMSTQEYMKKVVEDEDFKSGAWVSATDYV
nr:hypothetical protein [Tanacetum cinerariifolium]